MSNSHPDCPKAFCSSGEECARFDRCLFNGQPFACPVGCDLTYPHYHSVVTTPNGDLVPAVVSIAEDPNAEVRDPDTGEMIFPANKTKLRLIESDR